MEFQSHHQDAPRARTTLRGQLLLLTALVLLPIAIFGGWGLWSAIEQHRRDVERSTLELSRALASAVESELDGALAGLAVLARTRSLRSGDLPAFRLVAQDELAARDDWAAIDVLYVDGKPLLAVGPPGTEAPGAAAAADELARAARTGQAVVGGISTQRVASGAFPIHLPLVIGGRPAMVLTAHVKPDRILGVLSKQRIPQKWNAAVLDGNRLRIARSKGQASTVGRPIGPTLRSLVGGPHDSGTGITRTNEGAEVYTGYTRLPRYGWTVAVGAPTAETGTVLLRSILWYAGGILVSAWACTYLARRIAGQLGRDIHSVRDRAVQLGNGQAVALERSRIQEIDEMSVALSAASQRLTAAAEAMQEALERAERASRVKDQFLAMLGHELRNPLAPMVTALHLLDTKCDADTAHERLVLQRQLQHMRSLVDDLLDVSRIATGKFHVRTAPVDLLVVMQRALEALQHSHRPDRLVAKLPPDPVWVLGDEDRLLQAVTNLLTNACRFCPRGDIAVTLETHGEHALVRVQDSGVGMDSETLSQVFEPFYQAGQAVDRAAGGLGLGLAIVKAITERHGGAVRAQSEGPGKGSTFEIRLPVSQRRPAVSDVAAPLPVAAGGKLLLVDDNLDALETLAELLRGAGHEVETASHPHQALLALQRFTPDVGILDIGLPDMDGYALAAAARRALPGWGGALIALTGYGQQQDKLRAEEAGFALHLTKPADPAALLQAIDHLLAAGHAARDRVA